jgi:diguanylate cyclase (GGDEF)-like protein
MDKPFALIIEDERDVAALFRHVIDMAGYRSEIALHGRVAMERLSNSQPDLVLLDLNLPGVSGIELLEMIRKDQRLNYTRVIVITAHAHIAAGLRVQPDLLLLKPVSVEQLTRLVGRINLSRKAQKPTPMGQKPLDSYTGLYNQPFFMNRLESALRQSKEVDKYLFGLFLFKLEQNNKIKDQVDTQEWESIIREIAEALRYMLRPTDTIARFDQDTLYILIENMPSGDISVMIANRIQERLNRVVVDIGNKIKLPIRIGILLCDSGYKKVDQILGDAKYAQALASAQGDEYSNYYYQFSVKK